MPRTIRINGGRRTVEEPLRLAALVRSLVGDELDGVAVAVNGEVVTRPLWQEREVQDGDDIEIVRASQGG